jgi:putative salt-induced outer membrane protein
MIDAHEAGSMLFLGIVEIGIRDIGGRIPACGLTGWGGHGAQRIIGACKQAVERRQMSVLHAEDYSNVRLSDGILRGPKHTGDRKMYLRDVCLVTLLVLAAPVLAAEEEEAKSPWAGKALLGYLATSGNTNNSNLNSAFEISYTSGDWVHAFKASAIGASEDDVTTSEAYEAGWKSERSLSENNYLFGQLDWRKDRFSGYSTQFSQTVGYGRRLIDKEKHQLNAEIGAGARQSDLADGTEESETVLRGGLDYNWKIGDTSAFSQVLSVESGSENTYSESVTKLSASLVGNLALVASYTIKHNSDVPPLTENTDKFTAVSLEYTF